jgi:hypothetical protein
LPTLTGTQARRSLGAAEVEAGPEPDIGISFSKTGPSGTARNLAE